MNSNSKKDRSIIWILGAIILGVIFALIFGEKMSVVAPIGNIFISLIKMCCVPLVMCSIALSVAKMDDMRKMGRIGGKMLTFYILTGFLAGVIGISIGFITDLGSGIVSAAAEEVTAESFSFLTVIENMVPSNVFSSMANFDMLPCIIFSIFFGIGLSMIGEMAHPVMDVMDGILQAIYKIIGIVMKVAPIGIFALISSGIGSNGAEILSALGMLIVLTGIGCFILFIIYAITTHISNKIPYSRIIPAYGKIAVTAFSTRSSAATLPLTMKTAIHELDCDEEISNFVLPIGCTMNMNGLICEFALIAVLAGNFYGSPLTVGQCIVAILVSTISGIGMPGIPQGGSIFYVVLFSAIGLPNGSLIAMLLGVEALLDMIATTANVCGDIAVASIVTASERKYRN